MPISPRSRAQPANDSTFDTPYCLRAYAHHGMQLAIRGSQALTDCPFCGKEGKLSISVASGKWRCFVCADGVGNDAGKIRDTGAMGGGNALGFLRLLHAASVVATSKSSSALRDMAADRRLGSADTPAAWGACLSIIGGDWLIPGYGPDGKLDQLYRRAYIDGKWLLLPTPGIWGEGKAHALHMPRADFDVARPRVDVFEGPWDGMAYWEVWRNAGNTGDTNIIAVPGCNVWRDEWSEMCRGKHVTLWYDSDHPIPEALKQGRLVRPGFDGMYRAAKKLSGIAASVRWLRWGAEGYDPSRPSGWDVRDHLSRTGKPGDDRILPFTARKILLDDLTSHVENAPAEWFSSTQSSASQAGHAGIEAQQCSTWLECEAAWRLAMQWRQDMSDALAVLLAVCASTQQGGNQLFLQLIGSAGGGKTSMCDGLLVSRHCHHLEHLTGFHSGFKKKKAKKGKKGEAVDTGDTADAEKDCSLIARINGKTLVTPEADVLVSSPRFAEIMAQQRRIFDGKSAATYKNSDKDTLYVGLRTPWIMAGTPPMMDTDQSHLGDRFLRFIIDDPSEDEKRAILRAAVRSERVAMRDASNGTAGSILDPKTRMAHALTGGYVDWLRAHVEEQLALIEVSTTAEERCIDLAELSADLRARPNNDKRKVENHDTKELPTRLARQNIRMASCLAVVLNKREVDADVLRIIRKIALDTANGHSLNIVKWLCAPNLKAGGKSHQESGGVAEGSLGIWLNMNAERTLAYLSFLRKISVLHWQKTSQSAGAWLLTERVYDLYQRVMED